MNRGRDWNDVTMSHETPRDTKSRKNPRNIFSLEPLDGDGQYFDFGILTCRTMREYISIVFLCVFLLLLLFFSWFLEWGLNPGHGSESAEA